MSFTLLGSVYFYNPIIICEFWSGLWLSYLETGNSLILWGLARTLCEAQPEQCLVQGQLSPPWRKALVSAPLYASWITALPVLARDGMQSPRPPVCEIFRAVPFRWLLSWSWVVFLRAGADHYSAEQASHLLCGPPGSSPWANLSAQVFSHHELQHSGSGPPWTPTFVSSSQGDRGHPPQFHFLLRGLATSFEQEAGASTGFTSLVSHLPGSTALHCLMSTVLQNFLSYLCSFIFLSRFKWEDKSSPCYSI